MDDRWDGDGHDGNHRINGAPSTEINRTDITVYSGTALFNGVNAAGDLGLWATDGTSGGTRS